MEIAENSSVSDVAVSDALQEAQTQGLLQIAEWEESYKPLPSIFLCLFSIWIILLLIWMTNTWFNRQWRTVNLQWALTCVPLLKAVVLGLSLVFWYSCLNLGTCSFWVAFGVFVSRVFYETSCFVIFLLISHGYCITREQLSTAERRNIAGLVSVLYLTLTGYKAAVPHFLILLGVVYTVLLYTIFSHSGRNVGRLLQQLAIMEVEGTPQMRVAIYSKYSMFKKFQGAILGLVILELLMHARADGIASEYWVRLIVRECTEGVIFIFLGWTFRSREQSPLFSVIPQLTNQQQLPPIHCVEMNEKQLQGLELKQWQIGMPSTPPKTGSPLLVIIQNPNREDLEW